MDETFSSGDIAAAYEAASGASPAPAPETSAPAPDSASVPATAAPASEDSAPVSTGDPVPPGPIPFDRHKAALENARNEWRQKYGWAESVNPQDLQQLQSIARHFQGGDVEAGLRSFLAELRKDPAVDAKLRSLHARELAALRGQTAPPPPDLTPLAVQFDNGQTVGMFSGDQVKALVQQAVAQVEQKFSPVTQTVEQLQAERLALVQQQQVEHFVTTTFGKASTWIGMETPEAKARVAEKLAAAAIDPNDPREVEIALRDAYMTEIVPQLQAKERAAIVSTQQQKAKAGTINPAFPASSQQAPRSVQDMSWREALEHEWNKRAGGGAR